MSHVQRTPVYRITIFCPISTDTLAALTRGEFIALAADRDAGRIVEYVAASEDLGDFGAYRGVCEVSVGLEAFTPLTGAQPTLGRPGERSNSATAALTTYARRGVSPARLDELLEELAARHPWEVPVIEVACVELAHSNRPG